MEKKIKLITVILITLAVVGGGILFYLNQLQDQTLSREAGGDYDYAIILLEQWQADTPEQEYIAQSQKPAQYAGSMEHGDEESALSELTMLPVKPVKISEERQDNYNSDEQAYLLNSRGKRTGIGSSGTSQAGGSALAYGGNRNSGSSENSVTTGTLPVGSAPLLVPFKDDGRALIDPGAQTNNHDKNQILPVGNGVYALALLSLLYGLVIYFRRRG